MEDEIPSAIEVPYPLRNPIIVAEGRRDMKWRLVLPGEGLWNGKLWNSAIRFPKPCRDVGLSSTGSQKNP